MVGRCFNIPKGNTTCNLCLKNEIGDECHNSFMTHIFYNQRFSTVANKEFSKMGVGAESGVHPTPEIWKQFSYFGF
jgi:hypothetical protein